MLPRERIVEAAVSQLGATDPTPYWKDVLPGWQGKKYPEHWCGAFALWCLHQAGLFLELHWVLAKGFLCDEKGNFRLPVVDFPFPGDIGWRRKYQHHCVVEYVDGPTVHTIDGNSGDKPGGEVVRNSYPLSTFAALCSVQDEVFGKPYG